ncbi:unnamed protein product [Brachionus calyciflorus]|uniref:3-hydroxyacyl-CoA dehydrogenase n=1 Tax=Brachionus calyciflorus TaxID=104777 RepID=A0A814E7D2_9BILA|nr:unnamed protein product [Brachionus calyciflorus]
MIKNLIINNIVKRNFSSTYVLSRKINSVSVIGSGLMGSGIAQVTAEAGYSVYLIDQNQNALDKAIKSIQNSLTKTTKKRFNKEPEHAERYIKDTLDRIQTTTELDSGAEKSDLIIEAIVENIQVKHDLFSKLDSISPKETIFASNTSSLPISEIAQAVNRKDRFGGLHFFNPVPVMKLLEVIKTHETSDATYKTLLEYGLSIGKTTVECKDTPGFIVNRLLVPYMFEVVKMYERGDASLQDIDTAMKLGAGYLIGPFELLDHVGLDTSKFIIDGWRKRYPNDLSFESSPVIDKLVSEGKLGRKTGEGFYNYRK